MAIDTTMLTINTERLAKHIEELGAIGRNAQHELDRIILSKRDRDGRQWLLEKVAALGLTVEIDAAANIWATMPQNSEVPPIVMGSHLDTVPNGGKYDGALGVLIGLEIIETCMEQGIELTHPLCVVSFTGEEPNPFHLSTFGSRIVTGKLTMEDLMHKQLETGEKLSELLKLSGGDMEKIETAKRGSGELAAFLEVHIEQGKRLIQQAPIGIVTAITGIYREEIILFGEANHAGTTLMTDRTDALVIASRFVVAFEEAARLYPADEVVGTIGEFVIKPGAPSIIPNEARFLVEIRGDTPGKIMAMRQQVNEILATLITTYQMEVARTIILDQQPTAMDDVVIDTLIEAVPAKHHHMLLGSMAGHDATHIASIAPTGMLFVPSIDGKSHCPEEFSRIEDIETVANVLLHAIFALDQKL